MSLYVYITEACRKEAEVHSWQDELERLKQKVEQSQYLPFDHFPPPYRVKKKFAGRQGRLVAEVHKVGDHDVACFVSVLIRGDSTYDNFQANPAEYGKRHFCGRFAKADLESYVEARNRAEPPMPKPALSDAESLVLYRQGSSAGAGHDGEGLICEHEAWVAKATEGAVRDRLTEFFAVLSELNAGANFKPLKNRAGWGVFYLHLPDSDTTLLLEPVAGAADEQIPKLQEKFKALLAGPPPTREFLLRHSKRAYPKLLLADENLWLELEKDTVANIALSPEETTLLEEARGSDGAFPLFINGRAGSGKSTLLQYLFAEYLHRHLLNGKEELPAPPLYLTCSGDLLKQSRHIVESLIGCNAGFWETEDRRVLLDRNRPVLDEAFREFRPFLLSLVPPAERAQRFRPENHVDFTRFRRLWQEKFGRDSATRRECGPDICWHVIRSYIKGVSADMILDKEEYRQLELKQRSVTDRTFGLVHDRVWQGWYQDVSEAGHLWDDQDLARFLLERELVRAERPAVFCDEAQDFTRLELELILRLVLFSQRDVHPVDISRIPLVFAGDPFQTLNPTGFRWDATKAAYVEKFVLGLDPNRRSGVEELTYRELSYNYRSSRSIVRFGNLIQALRCRLFELRQVKPQEPWAAEHTSSPVEWFDAKNAAFWERFKGERNITIILPCGEGEEQEFIQNDPVLKSQIRLDEKGVPVDAVAVFSAGRAKGLEFDRVVVYGFGEHLQEDILTALVAGKQFTEDRDKALPIEYFINRLYVAVTRPKRRLFIVDTENGRKRLWDFATDTDIEESILSELADWERWKQFVGGIVTGQPEHLSLDQPVDLEEEARALDSQGRNRRDPYLLRSAATYYRVAGNSMMAARCTAEALYLEGAHVEAGKTFLRCEELDRAVDAFWRAKTREGYDLLLATASKKTTVKDRLEVGLARFLAGRAEFGVGRELLERLAERVSRPEEAVNLASCSHWTEPVNEVVRKIVDAGSQGTTPSDWANLAALLSRLQEGGFRVAANHRARIAYWAEDWAAAVGFWEAVGERNLNDYREAKARVAPYPEKLSHLKALGKHDLIIEAFTANAALPLDNDTRRLVGQAFLANHRLPEALEELVKAGALGEIWDVANAAAQAGRKSLAEKCARIALILAVERGQWTAVRDYVVDGRLPKAAADKQGRLTAMVARQKLELDGALTAALARSEPLTQLVTSEQKPISKFLRELEGQAGWQQHLQPLELGAAIERSQRFVDAIEFYERLVKRAATLEERRVFVLRWLITKKRMVSYYKGDNQLRRAKEMQLEIEQVKVQQHIEEAELVDGYPELDTLAQLIARELGKAEQPEDAGTAQSGAVPVAVEPASTNAPSAPSVPSAPPVPVETVPDIRPDAPAPPPVAVPALKSKPDVEVILGKLKVRLCPANSRANFEHQETSKTATLRLSPARCSSDDIEWLTVDANGKAFRCDEWGLEIDCQQLETEGNVQISMPAAGLTLMWKAKEDASPGPGELKP